VLQTHVVLVQTCCTQISNDRPNCVVENLGGRLSIPMVRECPPLTVTNVANTADIGMRCFCCLGKRQTVRSGRSGYTIATVFEVKKETPTEMSNPVYVSNVRIERRSGPLRIAHLPGEQQPVLFSVHGAIAEHYGLDPAKLLESHAATLDYVVAALGG
jgi:hypothetical protein